MAVLAVVSDGWPEPAAATSRFRLLEPQAGAVIRVPFIPALRLADDPAAVPLPRRARRALTQIQAATGRSFPTPDHILGDLTMLALALVRTRPMLRRRRRARPDGLAVSVPNPAPQPPPGLAGHGEHPAGLVEVGALVAGVFGLIGCGAMMAHRPPQPAQPRRGRRDRHPVGAGRADADRPVLRHRRRLHLRPAMFPGSARRYRRRQRRRRRRALARWPSSSPDLRRLRSSIHAHGHAATGHRHQPGLPRQSARRGGTAPASCRSGRALDRFPRHRSCRSPPRLARITSVTDCPGGFTDTPRGAVLAAVNIGVRTAAQWGPADLPADDQPPRDRPGTPGSC